MSGLNNFPAFPFNENNHDGSHYHSHAGMTLRDWFAGQVVGPTLIAMANGQHGVQPGKTVMESAAADAYAMADAMLAAREVQS